jgi:hypothetical protein
VKRMKIAASKPTFSIMAFSLSFSTTLNHAHGLRPIGGGACFSSACFNRGAYTVALKGRRKQKRRAIMRVIPMEVPSEASKAVSWIYLLLASNLEFKESRLSPRFVIFQVERNGRNSPGILLKRSSRIYASFSRQTQVMLEIPRLKTYDQLSATVRFIF